MGTKRRKVVRVVIAGAVVWLLLWIAGSLLIRYREPDTLTQLPTVAEGRFVELDKGRVHVIERGEGPPIVLVHGTGGSNAIWPPPVWERLSEKHRVVAIDLFGWGFSERDRSFPYGFTFWSEQIAETLTELDIERAIIIGHSLGAATCVRFAADHPEMTSRLIISGNGEWLAPAYIPMLIPGVGEFVLGCQAVPVKTFSDEHYAYDEAAYRIAGTRHALLKNARRALFESGDFFAAYPRVRAPVLQIHGTKDEEIPVWAMRKTHGRFDEGIRSMVLMEGSHHFVMNYDPDAYADAVLAFLIENESTGTPNEDTE